ncbi:hypothetical protein LPUS_00369 [Lasallia pustulata]|uniref:Uncharacterized protein n=1 Tax=Lasallia pustulata TaxID=136370 RepID=A0A1W5CXA1_9LECA|nr:hypothetical protein LPUS_00369 [Lasallia pustulata]
MSVSLVSQAPALLLIGEGHHTATSSKEHFTSAAHGSHLSTLERVIATHPPVFESLVLQLPTSALLDLYHTSRFLRNFLQSYPIAWNHLSFRLFCFQGSGPWQTSTGSDTSVDLPARRSKPYALDQLLVTVVEPFASRLKTLDLDNTAVSGHTLTSAILPARRDTLEHLSVRGCKNVSLKYHIVPYLTVFSLQKAASAINGFGKVDHLGLKSLYTFRCRHHRRRPYLPVTLLRRDSDAEPTHELVKICHNLGIWTDTAWCPTPAGRCQRRKEYHMGRGRETNQGEVWVVFDRLWRSGNNIGRSKADGNGTSRFSGQLWEEAERGEAGEPLGVGKAQAEGEGKTVPAHLRRSHRAFVDGFKCDDCGVEIHERCEQCSVRMHCMGCRKTFCPSCAFSRPLPRKRGPIDQDGSSASPSASKVPLWWAPGATRSPNHMQEAPEEEGHHLTAPHAFNPPQLKMQWCCLQPMFSGGGGIAFIGPGMGGSGSGQIRTAPLPKGQGWEDPEFSHLQRESASTTPGYRNADHLGYSLNSGHDLMLEWLLQALGSNISSTCPRNLCQECHQTSGWQARCAACAEPFCFEHDLRGLKMRSCGYRDLAMEKSLLKPKIPRLVQDCQGVSSVERLLEYLRHILIAANDAQPTTQELTLELASVSILPETDDSDLIEDSSQTAISTEISKKLSAPYFEWDSSIIYKAPPLLKLSSATLSAYLEGLPVWKGCASFFCPEYRSIGDHRPKCTATAKECGLCGVHVCPACLKTNPPCDCSFCKTSYRCPNCHPKLQVGVCKKIEEDEQKKEIEQQRIIGRLNFLSSQSIANARDEQVGDFFQWVEQTDAVFDSSAEATAA